MNGRITIVGLGSGTEDQLSLGIYKMLKHSKQLYLRTKVHPVVAFLEEEGISYQSFDYLYDSLSDYEKVYQEIANTLISLVLDGDSLVYAVSGHPMVAERSVQNLIKLGKEQGVEVDVLGGESFLDTFFARLHIDPIEGFLFLNGEGILYKDLDPSKHTVIAQVYDQWVASDLKLTLMELYPDDYKVLIASNLGMGEQEIIKEIPLYELDRHPEEFHHLSSLFIPKAQSGKIYEPTFSRLEEIIKILRSPDGCPWDRAQTHQSIRKNLIEETYELIETIDDLDLEHMIEELGDVLLQVMLHSQIASDDGYFGIHDVISQLNQKLIRRHPHVFGEEKAEQAEEAYLHWEQIKQQEKGNKKRESFLDGIPQDLPTIMKAYKLQKKAAKVGFDWEKREDVYLKIEEEIHELREAPVEHQLDELGDVLFAIINLARFMDIDPEQALASTNRKFIRRFNYIEQKLKENEKPIEQASLAEMEEYWNEAKQKLEE